MNRLRDVVGLAFWLALVGLAGCQKKQPIRLHSAQTLHAAMRPGVSDLAAYILTDATWVAGWPLLLNRDFDMAQALGMPGIGAGLAAAKRQQGNKEAAARLAELAPPALQAPATRAIEARCPACRPRLTGPLGLYGLLFGAPKARLLMALEWEEGAVSAGAKEQAARRVAYVTVERPLDGENGWIAPQPEGVAATMEAATDKLVDLLQRALDEPMLFATADVKKGSCSIGGTAKLAGRLVTEPASGRALLVLDDRHKTLLSCPVDAVKRDEPSPPPPSRPPSDSGTR